jgi:hypothetical protein
MNEAACKSDASALLGGALVIARGGQSRDAAAWQRRVGAEQQGRTARGLVTYRVGSVAVLQ